MNNSMERQMDSSTFQDLGIRTRDKIPIPTYRNCREFLESQSSDDEDYNSAKRSRTIEGPLGTLVVMTERKAPRYVNMEAEDIRAQFNSSLGIGQWPMAVPESQETVLDKEANKLAAIPDGERIPPKIFQDFLHIRSSKISQ